MSLSKPKEKNPATRHLEWSGSKGQFKTYNKEAGKDVFFKEDLFIVPLDEFSTIKGFHDASTSGIYSNEIKYLNKDILSVRAFKGGDLAKGLYSEIKGNMQGGKFARSLYCVLVTPATKKDAPPILELVNVSFVGSSLGSYIDAKIDVDSGQIVKLSPSKKQLKKGNTIYFEPAIKKLAVRKDILESCINYDLALQKYMKVYLSQNANETEIIPEIEAANMVNDFDEFEKIIENGQKSNMKEDDLPF